MMLLNNSLTAEPTSVEVERHVASARNPRHLSRGLSRRLEGTFPIVATLEPGLLTAGMMDIELRDLAAYRSCYIREHACPPSRGPMGWNEAADKPHVLKLLRWMLVKQGMAFGLVLPLHRYGCRLSSSPGTNGRRVVVLAGPSFLLANGQAERTIAWATRCSRRRRL